MGRTAAQGSEGTLQLTGQQGPQEKKQMGLPGPKLQPAVRKEGGSGVFCS